MAFAKILIVMEKVSLIVSKIFNAIGSIVVMIIKMDSVTIFRLYR